MATAAGETIHAVVIVPQTAAEVGKPADDTSSYIEIDTLAVPVAMLDRLQPIPSAVTAVLGHSLNIAPWPSKAGKTINPSVNCLFLQTDPTDEEFGKVKHKNILGAVVLAREDGVNLTQQYVQALLAYLGGLREEMKEFARLEIEVEEKVEKATEIAGRVLTKEAFKEYFGTFKKDMMAKGEKGWENVELHL